MYFEIYDMYQSGFDTYKYPEYAQSFGKNLYEVDGFFIYYFPEIKANEASPTLLYDTDKSLYYTNLDPFKYAEQKIYDFEDLNDVDYYVKLKPGECRIFTKVNFSPVVWNVSLGDLNYDDSQAIHGFGINI